ncbi:hypothetical protein [Demequina sp.]|uniref:hypothetical protein n=1 Tax=Demequina sp. TaxID=2050685 RepID=UPI0025C49812|nr:hypothetical protein [Demequina sp.]
MFGRVERFHCPRRAEVGALPGGVFWTRKSDKPADSYAERHGLIGQQRGCTYCGSLPPDDFMRLVRDGAVLSATHKNYKVYVTAPVRAKFYFQHLSEAQRREFFELYTAHHLQFEEGVGFSPLPFFIKRGGATS